MSLHRRMRLNNSGISTLILLPSSHLDKVQLPIQAFRPLQCRALLVNPLKLHHQIRMGSDSGSASRPLLVRISVMLGTMAPSPSQCIKTQVYELPPRIPAVATASQLHQIHHTASTIRLSCIPTDMSSSNLPQLMLQSINTKHRERHRTLLNRRCRRTKLRHRNKPPSLCRLSNNNNNNSPLSMPHLHTSINHPSPFLVRLED